MSDRFILELPIQTTPHDKRELNIRLDCARQIYNAVLGESLKRLSLIKQSKNYKKAIKIKDKKSEERKKLFDDLRLKYGFYLKGSTKYNMDNSIFTFSSKCRNDSKWISQHLDSQVVKTITKRAFQTVENYSFYKIGKPFFKRKYTLNSIEGINNIQSIIFRKIENNYYIIWNSGKNKNILKLKVIINKKSIDYINYGLNKELKFTRLVKKIENKKEYWYAQLCLDGIPIQRTAVGYENVGIDFGPSTIAIVGDTTAILTPFCNGIIDKNKEIKQIQRKMDRSKRSTNPNNYNENRTNKKGIRKWNFSNKYKKYKKQVIELERKLRETRKTQHGNLSNKVIEIGVNIKTEKISNKWLQKLYGKSIRLRAPGMFISTLKRKAKQNGGDVFEFNTSKTKLTQYNHYTNDYKKERSNLKERYCEINGKQIQRDLKSAYYAKYVDENESLDILNLNKNWASLEPILEQAVSRCNQTTNGKDRLSSLGLSLKPRQSSSPVKCKSSIIDDLNVVAINE